MKKYWILLAGFLLYSTNVQAANLSNYLPTLRNESAYSLYFTKLNSETNSDYKFTSYEVSKDNKVVPVYYGYNYNIIGISGPRISSGNGNLPVSQNFISIYSSNYGGGIFTYTGELIGSVTGDFIGNSSGTFGGGIYSDGGTISSLTGDFIGNYAKNTTNTANGGAIYTTGKSVVGDITGNFIGNYAQALNVAHGGAIYTGGNDTKIGNIRGDFIYNFAESTSSSSYGGAIRNAYGGYITSIIGDFIGNHAAGITAQGGAIYSLSSTSGIGNLVGNYIGNYVKAAVLSDALGGAIYNSGPTLNFSPQDTGQNISFIGNYVTDGTVKKLNSIHNASGVINFLLQEGSFADIRDPITGAGTINKDVGNIYNNDGSIASQTNGLGSMYLWGDNSGFTGNLNINTGSFYAMFEDNQTPEQAAIDPLGQRVDFNLNNAKIKFEDGALFRPMMNNAKDKLAALTSSLSKLTVNGIVKLVPYALSQLDVGHYEFNNDYSKFAGWENSLAKVDTNSQVNKVFLEIKSDLAGYQDLTEISDIYRKRNDLSLAEREVLDNIYLTGIVPAGFEDLIKILEGKDYSNFEKIHRASVRQHNRQVISRVQNKNCPSCGRENGFSDQHFWFNISNNQIKKDNNSKSMGYKYDPTGFAMGYDYDIIPQALTMGIAMSYATGEVKNKAPSGVHSVDDVEEYLMSLYGKYKPFRAYVSWNAGAGLMTNKTRLVTDTNNSRGEYDTYAFFANIDFGYDLGATSCDILEPYIGFEYTHIFSEGYNEKGIGARHFDRMDWDIFEVPIGLRASKDLFWRDYIFTPAIDLAYARNFGDTSAKTTAAFVGNRGDSWSISSSSDKRDSFRANLNFKINAVTLPFALNLGYSTDYRSDYTDQQFYSTIRWDF